MGVDLADKHALGSAENSNGDSMNQSFYDALRQLTAIVKQIQESANEQQLTELKEHLSNLERQAGSAAFSMSIRNTFGSTNTAISGIPFAEAQPLAQAA